LWFETVAVRLLSLWLREEFERDLRRATPLGQRLDCVQVDGRCGDESSSRLVEANELRETAIDLVADLTELGGPYNESGSGVSEVTFQEDGDVFAVIEGRLVFDKSSRALVMLREPRTDSHCVPGIARSFKEHSVSTLERSSSTRSKYTRFLIRTPTMRLTTESPGRSSTRSLPTPSPKWPCATAGQSTTGYGKPDGVGS